VNFGSPQPLAGSYRIGLHRYGSPLLGHYCTVPIQGKLGIVLRGSATLSQGYQKRVRRRGRQRALSFRARRTRFELSGVLTHMVRCHVGHCIFNLGLLYHACVSEGGQGVQNTLRWRPFSSRYCITGASTLRRLLGARPLIRL
jgi:hypothetical protein